MIVDDDRETLLLLQKIAARLTDAEIECHRSPQDALASFEALPGGYEVVITDLEMPGLNGLELCRLFRALSPSLKILLVTGAGTRTATLAELVDMGFCGVVAKPITIPALENALVSAGVVKSATQPAAAAQAMQPG
jgi:CheY-like chemotaxis protein